MGLGDTYKRVYGAICGVHPYLRPWHSQWLAGSILYRPLRAALADIHGAVLDVGCGTKPYESWAPHATEYAGIDVTDGPKVDAVIKPGQAWPLEDGRFDTVLCTQVLEHAIDVEHVVGEIARVLKPGGQAIVSVPFIYNEHDPDHDYRRLARRGVETQLAPPLKIVETTVQGAVGSSLGVLFLNWIALSMGRSRRRLAVFVLLMPFWIVLSSLVNAAGWLLDRLDRTETCYGNVMVRAVKP
jgi:SAM-dependent methyltransferase